MPDGTVRAMLLARVDELTARMTSDLDEVRAVTEQREPEPATRPHRAPRRTRTVSQVPPAERR
jgi:hypothetical protein